MPHCQLNKNGNQSSNEDLDIDAPNPANPNPQSNEDCPLPRSYENKIQAVQISSNDHIKPPVINRPPKPPGSALGPYLQFITTDLVRMRWLGSILIFRHVSFERPVIELVAEVAIEYEWEILYENIFNLRAYRLNLSIELRDGVGDDEIHWKINWGEKITEGMFHIARYQQNWRGGFFSCNGFDATVSEQRKSKLKFSNVWDHLNSLHLQTPLHLLIWGGDQTYIDFIFDDVPYLKQWTEMKWNEKWTCDFRDDLREQIEEYHFNTYIENWERIEVRNALGSIPSVMMWDDHDIFDGAGSYPKLLHDSPMMTGLFKTAQKMRLLFQHHTTIDKARAHQLFGHQGYNFLTRCGPNLVILGADGRSERSIETVQHEKTWDMIFERLDSTVNYVPHLIVLFPVPFSFLRFKLAESIFDHLKKVSTSCRNVGVVKHNNSIFGLPELYDDLLDEWTHEVHMQERNSVLGRFQEFAQKKRIRITFFSGDVHCCGISRFRSPSKQGLTPEKDEKLMYQIISSAIVNLPPPKNAIRLGHYFKTKWKPIRHTKEELIDFFQHNPENGRRQFHKKLLPNRNWCYFEQCEQSYPTIYTGIKTGFIHRTFGKKQVKDSPAEMEMKSKSVGLDIGMIEENNSSKTTDVSEQQSLMGNLRVRLWLESGRHHREGRSFVNYDLLVPCLSSIN